MKKTLLISSSIIIFVVAVCVIGYMNLVSNVFKEFKTSEPKIYALGLAKNSTEVVDEIGNGIFIDSLQPDKKQKAQFKLELNLDGFSFGQDAVNLKIPIEGNNGKARLFIVAEKENDQWNYETIKLEIDRTNRVINLLEKSNK
jgi:hypothetical protein